MLVYLSRPRSAPASSGLRNEDPMRGAPAAHSHGAASRRRRRLFATPARLIRGMSLEG